MISMTDFQQIIILRNEGKTQSEIASKLNISRRSVIRYLKAGKIPAYTRENLVTRPDPLLNHFQMAEEKIYQFPRMPLNELYEFLVSNGYEGSVRTLRRKTVSLRRKLKNKEVFFQRQVNPGEVMEGDFTEFQVAIGGLKKKIYIWINSLPYSNAYFATPYYNCTFECFADGTVRSFNEFKGVPKQYRLDNLSPAVGQILSGKNRLVTQRFAELQKHYNFKQDFCNPGKGNEKGNVEANNKHFKEKLRAKIALENVSFTNLEAFRDFVWKLCREHNESKVIQKKYLEENLNTLPETPFKSFKTEVVKINKYSLFSLGTSGHMYSVPSLYIGLSLEVRVYPHDIEVVELDKVIATHKRIYGPKGLVSIKVEHIITGLLRKPGAFKDWKHRDVLFERPAWKRFYFKIIESGKSDKDFLKCLNLLTEFDRENVTLAMELSMENEMELSSSTLKKLITNEFKNVLSIGCLPVNLEQYDCFYKGEKNYGSENSGQS